MHNPRKHHTLSSGLVAEIEHCAACGLVHLHIGAPTLRLQPAALHDLRATPWTAQSPRCPGMQQRRTRRPHPVTDRDRPMRRMRPGHGGFPLTLSGITIAGLLSALVDGTLGWEQLAHALLSRIVQ